MKSALTLRMTSGLEKTASRAAPANTQQRASSTGRSMKTQSNTGFFFSRDSLRPSSRQLFQAISRQATLAGLRVSISAFKAWGVAGFLSAAGDGWVQAKPTNTTEHTTIVRLRMLFPRQLACGKTLILTYGLKEHCKAQSGVQLRRSWTQAAQQAKA